MRLWPGNVGWRPLGPGKMQSLGEGGIREVQVTQISVLSPLICQIREPLLDIYRILSNSPFWASDRFHTFNRGSPIAKFLSSSVCAGGYEETPFLLWATR